MKMNMPAQWRKRGEPEPPPDPESPKFQVEFVDTDLPPRDRRQSSKEKLANKIGQVATGLTKAGIKIKEKIGKKPSQESKSPSKDPDTFTMNPEEDVEKFRRLIAFVFREENLQEFLSILQALGFKHLGGFEYLGWRDADYSIAKDIDLLHRLHMRVYILSHIVFVLAHYEPKATQDIKLHVKGYFDHLIGEIKNQTQKQGSTTTSEAEPKNDKSTKSGEERFELSDYEKGSELLLKILKDSVPNFYTKIDPEIGDDELRIWQEYLGQIDHIPPEERMIEELRLNSRYIPPFQRIRSTVQKMFECFGFHCYPAWDLKIPPTDKYFIIKAQEADKPLDALILTEDFIDDLMRVIGALRTKYRIQYVLVITSPIALFGPAEDDIPPQNVEITPFNPQRVKDLVTFLSDLGISIMSSEDFIELFRFHLKNPLRFSHFRLLFKHPGLLSADIIPELVQENKIYEKFYSDILHFIELLQSVDRTRWYSLKAMKKGAEKANLTLSEHDLLNIIRFLENPFLDLLESKENKREEYRINPNLTPVEIDQKLELVAKLLKESLLNHTYDKEYKSKTE
jgi:hypothetical protein